MNSHDLDGILWNVSVHDSDLKKRLTIVLCVYFLHFGQFKHLKMENLYQK